VRRILIAAFSLGLLPLGAVHAMGLAEISQQSGLGEPLRLVIPVIANGADAIEDDDLAGECFKVVPAMGNDLPQPRARLMLERRGLQSFVVLTTTYPIDEPMLRVAVQAGCRVSISREYIVLLDPINIDVPETQVAAAGKAANERATEPPMQAPSSHLNGALLEGRPQQTAQVATDRGATAPRTRTTASIAAKSAAAMAPPKRPAKPAIAPRLQISRTVGDGASAPAAGTPPTPAGNRETLMAIEEQTVVLQRQIAELTRQMEAIQLELREAQRARAVAEKTARIAAATLQPAASERAGTATSWWSLLRSWLADDWALILLAPLLVGLLAAHLAQRRSQRPLVPRPLTATQAASFNAADLGEPSVPNPEAERDKETLVASMKDRPRGHMIPPVFVDPIERDKPGKPAPLGTRYEYDPGISVADMNVEDVDFDEEVRKAHEQASEYSLLEREEPGIVSRLIEGWGTPRATAQLDNYLLAPRRSGKPLSLGAMEELKLLRSIAMEQVADLGMHRRIGNLRTPAGTIAGTH
jgi:hypothetical protein